MPGKSLALLLLAALVTFTHLGCSSGGGSGAAPPSAAAPAAAEAPASDGTPVLTAFFPATTYAGASAQTLTLVGSGFKDGATVTFNGVTRAATFVGPTHLTAELTSAELAAPGTFPVVVTNPGPAGKSSLSRDFTLLSLNFGETDIAAAIPDWTAETHGKLKTPAITANLAKIFDPSQVQRLDITIAADNWAVMQSNLALLKSQQPSQNTFLSLDDPIYVPCEVTYNGKQWYRVGIRFKGNSSLYGATGGKLPFKLKFNEFEDIYPAIANQRFYGFKSFSLKNNYQDEAVIRELAASQLYRDFGLVGPHCAFYTLYVNYGSGPVYYGLYTLVEEVDDTVLKTQYADAGGNLYKPEEAAATLRLGSFDTYELAKKTNEAALDYRDIKTLYDVLNSNQRVSDPPAWKAELEKILDVPIFLKWFAANNVLQNWDTYGVMPHNYYLYRNPATQRFEWIPWDNNEALTDRPQCLSLGAEEVTSRWPLLQYLLADAAYAARYKANVHEFAGNLFNAARMTPIYDTQAALIESAVLNESAGYTYTSASKFPAAIAALKAHVAAREATALAF